MTADACNLWPQNSNNSNIPDDTLKIIVVPVDDETTPNIFLLEGGSKICRRRPLDTDYGLDPEETADDDDENENQEEGSETERENETNKPRYTTVGENWFQIGLIVANKHNNYYAVIDSLTFIISAPYGSETLQGRDEISSGYCNSNPLYIAPPLQKGASSNAYKGEPFEPLSPTSRNNLILFVDGVPIPDGPPKATEEGDSAYQNIQQTAQASGNPAGGQTQEPFILKSLPKYTVKLIAFGYWIDKSRKRKAILRKSISFQVTSNFLN